MNSGKNLPVYLHVIDEIKKEIIHGKLAMGEKLPSTRELAIQYQINPNTAARIYYEMKQANICYTKRGLGTFITEDVAVISKMKEEMTKKLLEYFTQEMLELGFTKQELIYIVTNHLEKQTVQKKREYLRERRLKGQQ